MSNKILIDFRRIADNTGISSYLKMILKAINEDDNVYFLLLNEKDKNFEFSKYVNTDKIKLIFCSSKPFSLKSNIEIPMLINKYKIRLFHSTHFDIPLGIIFCPNCNLVSTIHDIIPLKYSQYYKTSIIKYLYFILMYNACAILSKKIITVSNYSKADLILCGHTHIPCGYSLSNGKTVINVGSVGRSMTKDKMPVYLQLTVDKNGKFFVEHKIVKYDNNIASNHILSRGFKHCEDLARMFINE